MMLYSTLLLSLLAVTSASDRWENDPEMSDVDSETTIGGSSDTFDPNAPHPSIPGCSSTKWKLLLVLLPRWIE
jgi:hypothetical protein